jgi:hypothetical protein
MATIEGQTELVGLKVELVVTLSTDAALAAKKATASLEHIVAMACEFTYSAREH